jgi:hypothetical protein
MQKVKLLEAGTGRGSNSSITEEEEKEEEYTRIYTCI